MHDGDTNGANMHDGDTNEKDKLCTQSRSQTPWPSKSRNAHARTRTCEFLKQARCLCDQI